MTATANYAGPQCPVCKGEMWDEQKSKFYKPGKPIWKCKDKACGSQGGVIWPPKNGSAPPQQTAPTPVSTPAPLPTNASPLDALFRIHSLCFDHALKHAILAEQAGIGSDLNAVSALTAQLFIAATKS